MRYGNLNYDKEMILTNIISKFYLLSACRHNMSFGKERVSIMKSFQYAKIHFIRNRKRNLVISLIIAVILLAELLCFCLSSAATRGEQDAFIYNGAAFQIDIDSDHSLTDSLRDAITEIDHVTGLSCWSLINTPDTMTAETLVRSEDHTGYTFEETDVMREHAHQFVLIADIDTSVSYHMNDPHLSLTEGVFPDRENQGLLIESRVAAANGIQCGDMITFSLGEDDTLFSLPVCGIYTADTDFEIADPNEFDYEEYFADDDEPFDPYWVSPYNYIYASYDAIAAFTGEPIGQDGTARVFVDSYDSIEIVLPQLKELLGDEYELYDSGSTYLEDWGSVLILVRNFSQIVSGLVAVTGILLVLIIMTYFAIHFQYECGLMIMIGQSRRSILLRYLLVVLMIVLSAGLLATLLYFILGPILIQMIVDAANLYAQGTDGSYGYYETSLSEPFSMTASVLDLFTPASLLAFLGVGCVILASTAAIPIWCVLRAQPRRLLE